MTKIRITEKFMFGLSIVSLFLLSCSKDKARGSEYSLGETRTGIRGVFVENNYGEHSCGNLFIAIDGEETFANDGIKVLNCPDSVFSTQNYGKTFIVDWKFSGSLFECIDGGPDYIVPDDQIPKIYLEMISVTSILPE